MNREINTSDVTLPTHEVVYRSLRSEILGGCLNPGQVLTLRSLAKKFRVSVMPVREAVRRLVAEGALQISSSGRISTPILTNERIEELASFFFNLGVGRQLLPEVGDEVVGRAPVRARAMG